MRERLAKGDVLRSRGLRAVADREILTPGGSGAYSSAADIARYVAALVRIKSGEQESVLTPRALAEMFRPRLRPDPRLPGMGLGFELARERDHRVVRKGGTMAIQQGRWRSASARGGLRAFTAPDQGRRRMADPVAGATVRRESHPA